MQKNKRWSTASGALRRLITEHRCPDPEAVGPAAKCGLLFERANRFPPWGPEQRKKNRVKWYDFSYQIESFVVWHRYTEAANHHVAPTCISCACNCTSCTNLCCSLISDFFLPRSPRSWAKIYLVFQRCFGSRCLVSHWPLPHTRENSLPEMSSGHTVCAFQHTCWAEGTGSVRLSTKRLRDRSPATGWIAVALLGQERSPQPPRQEANFMLRPAANCRRQN